MNTNMSIISADKLIDSLPQDALRKILVLVAGAEIARQVAVLIKEAAPEIKHAIDRVYDLRVVKLALKYDCHPRDISNRYEASTVYESSVV